MQTRLTFILNGDTINEYREVQPAGNGMSRFFTHETKHTIQIIRFTSYALTLSNSNDLKKELEQLVKSGKKNFIFDFTEVKFITSLMIAILIFFLKLARDKGGNMILCGLSKEAAYAFEVSRTEKVFTIYHGLAEAWKHYSNK